MSLKWSPPDFRILEKMTALLEGEFAGVKGCTVGVSVLKSTNVVNLVGVLFPNQDNWTSLENRYLLLKSMLMEKYGSPAHCVEEFQMYGVEKDEASGFTAK